MFVVLFAKSHALYSQQKHDKNNKTNANKINHNLEIGKKEKKKEKRKKTLIALMEEHNTRVHEVNYTALTCHKINGNK